MNNKRRKEIIEVRKMAEEIQSRLESIYDDEQEYYDNIPENLMESERADNSEEALESLEVAIAAFEDIFDALDEIN